MTYEYEQGRISVARTYGVKLAVNRPDMSRLYDFEDAVDSDAPDAFQQRAYSEAMQTLADHKMAPRKEYTSTGRRVGGIAGGITGGISGGLMGLDRGGRGALLGGLAGAAIGGLGGMGLGHLTMGGVHSTDKQLVHAGQTFQGLSPAQQEDMMQRQRVTIVNDRRSAEAAAEQRRHDELLAALREKEQR